MLTWLLVTLLVAIGSALFPPLSVELFIVTLAARHPQYPALLLGAIVAIGQIAGKLLYFYAGRGSLHLPAFIHRSAGKTKAGNENGVPAANIKPESGPLRAWHRFANQCRRGWAWLRMKCHAHPKWMMASTATSAVIGIPPFMATTVLAGLAGLSLRAFILSSLPARFVRFSVLAASPMLVVHFVPGLRHGHHPFWFHWLHFLVH
ncbi:MAG TPA: hypothetical protein VG756_04310 [Pseudonocardiaceae bacterium]|nr:hypothetical protein [Pseudonocardiaceae bacterium]